MVSILDLEPHLTEAEIEKHTKAQAKKQQALQETN